MPHTERKEEMILEIVASKADEVTPILLNRIADCSTAAEVIEVLSSWAEERSRSQDLAFLMFEVLQYVRRFRESDARFTGLFGENWRAVGQALRRFVPDGRTSATDEEIVALIVALTYGPITGGGSGHSAGRLVKVVLEALMGTAAPAG